MRLTGRHPEDVKAAIRKRFITLKKFEAAHGLPEDSVSDLLRGKPSARVAAVVDAFLVMENAATAVPVSSDRSDNIANRRRPHRLNAEAA